jgi:hypothetical protein
MQGDASDRTKAFSDHLARTLGFDEVGTSRAILRLAEKTGVDPRIVYEQALVAARPRLERLGRRVYLYTELMPEAPASS